MKKNFVVRFMAVSLAAAMICGSVMTAAASESGSSYEADSLDRMTVREVSANASKPSSIKLTKLLWEHTGKVLLPTFTVKDGGKTVGSKYYTVTAAAGDNAKTVGPHKATITFKSPYAGSATYSYDIVPKGTAISSLSATDDSITVKYKKQAKETTGYLLQYSTNSSFNGATDVKLKGSESSKVITGLNAGTKYYVRICTYKTVNGKDYFSSWSSKSVTTKTTAGSSSKNTLDNLTFDRVISKFSVAGKPFASWTPETMQTYLKSKAKSSVYGKLSNGNYGTVYTKSNKAIGAYCKKDSYTQADIVYGPRGVFAISKFSKNKKGEATDITHYQVVLSQKNSNNFFAVNDQEICLMSSSISNKHPVKSTVKATVEAICPGLYAKVSKGKAYNGKNYKAYYNSDGEFEIDFFNEKEEIYVRSDIDGYIYIDMWKER